MLKDLAKKSVLIIDDFSNFRNALKRMLESLGVKDFTDASNGDDAILAMSCKSFDIIICDYNLGYDKKDGQQVLEEGKHRGLIRYSSIFVMLTAESSMPMVMGAVEYQPDDYLIKPVTKEILKSRLEKLMKKKADFEEIEEAILQNHYRRAISLCDDRIGHHPKNLLEYLRLKADLLLTTGNLDEATAVFQHVLKMREIPWARSGLGKVHFLSGDYLKARDIFQSIIDENRVYMEAYDWLAKALEKLGSLGEAQQALMAAAEISPKSVLRQKMIGEISYRNRDYETAEKSLKTAIKLGRTSYLKSPSHYTALAKVLVEKDSGAEALTVLRDARKEFKGSPDASLQAAVMEGIVYRGLKREEAAKKALEEATGLLDTLSEKLSPTVAMDMAKICFDLGEKEQGTQLMKDVIRNYHDNEDVVRQVGDVFREANLLDEGNKIITSTRKEIIQVNNQGVRLVEEGNLSEAIDFFEKAAKGLPENKIINANAAQALLMYMQKNGIDGQYLSRVPQYLERIRKIDSSYGKYHELLSMYEKIAASRQ